MEKQAHNFELVYFKKFTFCALCTKFIWGVTNKQGYCCTVCKYPVHKKCRSKVPADCMRPSREKSKKEIKPEGRITTLAELVKLMKDPDAGLVLRDRRQGMVRTFNNCFIGSEAIDWMLRQKVSIRSRVEAVRLGNRIIQKGYWEPLNGNAFKDAENKFFRFTERDIEVGNDAIEEADNGERELTADDFIVLKVIGRGGFGKVLKVQKKGTDLIYAMKVMSKANIVKPKQVQSLLSEKNIMLNDCPYLIHLHYSFQDSDKVYLVMDLITGGDLGYHLNHKRRFPEKSIRVIVAELVLALEHLHNCGIIYRDLKPENVLMDEFGHICLTDFGLSKQLGDEEDRTATVCGTPVYLAPEVVRGQRYGKSVDWWSLGVVIYEMISGVNPFYAEDFREIIRLIKEAYISFPKEQFSADAQSLLAGLLQREPEKRLGCGPEGADEIKSHPWFSSIDWAKLEVKKVESTFKIEKGKDNFDPVSGNDSFEQAPAPNESRHINEFDFKPKGDVHG